jgi:hypothetical protein
MNVGVTCEPISLVTISATRLDGDANKGGCSYLLLIAIAQGSWEPEQKQKREQPQMIDVPSLE